MQKFKETILYQQYNKFSLDTKASLWFVACNFIQKAISLLTLPIFTRVMTTQQYGLVTLFTSWESILSIFVTLNLGAGVYVTAYVKFEDDKGRLTSSFLGLSTFVTTVGFVVYLFFRNFFNEIIGMPTIAVILMFLQLYVTPAYSMWSMEQKFEQKYVKLIIITLVMAVLTPALGVVSVILSENKAIAKIASGVLIQLICCGVLYIYIIYRGRKIFDKKYWSYGISFAIPLLPHYLSLTILNQSDRIMIANLEGQDKAAIYGVAYTLASVISLIFASINNSFGPWSVRKIKSGQYNEICLRIRKIMPCIVVIVLGLLCFEPEIILIFASKEYYEAIWVMPPITVGLFFTFINSIFLRVEFYYEMKYLIVLSSCIAAFLNIILNAVYIPQYGYYAAGYTTMICYLLLCVSHYFAMRYVSRKYMNKSRVFETGYIVKMSIIVILTAAIMYPLYKHIVIRYMVLIALLIILFIKRKPIIKIMREIQ